jgi:glycosyltransferase involved in cell wall biosynthesis
MLPAMAQPWISVVVPAFNEERTIAGTLTALRERLEGDGRPYEILVVDNGSTDRTIQSVEAVGAGPAVRVLRNDVNRGKGYSVRRGMLEASGSLRLLCDADCAPSLVSLPRMVQAIEHADVAIGSRLAPGADVGRAQPLRRRLVGWPYIALTRLLLREPTRDVYCGFKLWRGVAAQAVFPRQEIDGWAFDAESLAMARRLGYRLTEVGITWVNREASKLSIFRTLVPAVRDLLRARRNVRAHARAHAALAADTLADSSESSA